MNNSSKKRPDKDSVEAIKRSVKRMLDAVDPTGASKERLQRVMQRAASLEDQPDRKSQLTRFVLIISSLVQHARFGGLTRTQVRKGAALALSILETLGITPGTSQLAYLYGELHLVLSQIYRKDGAHWHAAWQQYEAMNKAKRDLPGGDAFQSLASANRAIRLGHGRLALWHYARAEAGDLSSTEREKARLARIKALRLVGDLEASARLAEETAQSGLLSYHGERELVWESFCRDLAQHGSPALMLASLRRGRPHHDAIYLLEASLWTKAMQQREWMEKVVKVRTMAKKQNLQPHRYGTFYTLAAQFDGCYDLSVPLAFRIRDLGMVLADTAALTTIDKELLAWVAAARFLARSRAIDHAALALSEYTGLCLRLSEGRSRDVLGIAGDLLDRTWFKEFADEALAS